MKKFLKAIGLLIIAILPYAASAQQKSLREQVISIAEPVKGIVGVSILGLESGDTLSYNGSARLVLQSVIKFPIAITVLHLVDSGKLALDQLIHVTKRDLPKNTHSPLRDKYPKGGEISISELLSYMISLSDNNACDILLKEIGGTQVVQDYLLRLHFRGIAIRASEAEMDAAWEVQYTNWCKPDEMTRLLEQFYNGRILSKTSTAFLYKIMTETTTGPNRIKGLLPAGTVVAHKTGSSSVSAEGLAPATNDVGIITLPDGKHLAISVFVCNTTANEAARDAVIAKIAKAAWDFYAKRY